MTQKTWIKVGAGLLLLAWTPFLYAELTSDTRETKGRDLPSATDAPELPSIEAEPEGQEAEEEAEPAAAAEPDPSAVPAAPDPQAPAPGVAAPPSEPAPDPTAAEAVVDEGEEAAPVPPTASGQTAVFKHAFDTQPRDALWAGDTETRIGALFGTDELPKELLKGAACRKAVCRVEIQWSEELAPAYEVLEHAVLDTFGGELAVEPLGAPDDEGKLQVNLYLPRKGYTVADLAQ